MTPLWVVASLWGGGLVFVVFGTVVTIWGERSRWRCVRRLSGWLASEDPWEAQARELRRLPVVDMPPVDWEWPGRMS